MPKTIMPKTVLFWKYLSHSGIARQVQNTSVLRGHACCRICRHLLMGLVLGWSCSHASSYSLPVNGDALVGGMQAVEAKAEDTLLDIARRFDLGYNEITAANPGVDPWLPGLGTRIVVPTWFVLPQPPWKGIVVNLAEMRLYYFPKSKRGVARKVITYPLGIGHQFRPTPKGNYKILMKIKDPNWTMPEAAYARALADGIQSPLRVIPPGPDNPLGEYAMMLDNDGLFIHGTNRPFGIGMRVSSGCLRLYPEDIRHFAALVPVGTPVRIVDQPYKIGKQNGVLFVETHIPTARSGFSGPTNLTPIVSAIVKASARKFSAPEWNHIITRAKGQTGIPTAIFDNNAVSLSSTP